MVKNKFMQLVNQDNNKAELYIYGDIVDYAFWENDVDANTVRNQLKDLQVSEIDVHINSYGGDVFTGIAIYNMLKNHSAKINVYIDACACSIASVIAMAGDKIYMPKNTLMMIHNCWTIAMGNSKELRKTADDLDIIMNTSIESYMSRVKITREELIELLDNETWLTAEECVEKGFADEVLTLKEEDRISQKAILFNLVQKVKENEKGNQAPIQDTSIDYSKLAKEISKELTLKSEISEKVEEIEEEIEEKTEEKKETILNGLLNLIEMKGRNE